MRLSSAYFFSRASNRLSAAGLHIFYNLLAKFRAFQQSSSFHLAVEVVGYSFFRNSSFETFIDQISSFLPSHVFEHHHTRKNHRTRVDFILASIFWSRAMRSFTYGVTRHVIYVSAWSNAYSSNNRRERIRNVIAI